MPLLILTSFNSVDMFSHPCPTLAQSLPTVPQAQMFTDLIILEAIVQIISVISIASASKCSLWERQRCELRIQSVLPSLQQGDQELKPAPFLSLQISYQDRAGAGGMYSVHYCDSLRGLEETPISLLPTGVVREVLGRLRQGLCSGA